MAAEPEDLAARIVRVLTMDPFDAAYRRHGDPDVKWINGRRNELWGAALAERRSVSMGEAQDMARVAWVRKVLAEGGVRCPGRPTRSRRGARRDGPSSNAAGRLESGGGDARMIRSYQVIQLDPEARPMPPKNPKRPAAKKFTISVSPEIERIIDDEAERLRAMSGEAEANRSAAIRTLILEAMATRAKKNRK